MAWLKVLNERDLPPLTGKKVVIGKCALGVFRLSDGSLRALANQCPHRQGSLADGIISGRHVYCPLHDWKINLDTGRAEEPDEGETEVFAVKMVGDEIFIEFDEVAQSMCESRHQAMVSSGWPQARHRS